MRKILIALTAIAICATAASAADSKAGQAIYVKSCKSCHGLDGTPNPGMVKALKVDMKNLGSAEAQALSDDAIEKIVTTGKGKMKPVTSVTGKSVEDVVAYVRTLKK